MVGESPAFGRKEFLTFSGAAALGSASRQSSARSLLETQQGTDQQRLDTSQVITIFLCGDVMIGRGVDQILPNPGDPRLCEDDIKSAKEYVDLGESVNGRIPKPADFSYIWGDALAELDDVRPDMRLINLETSVTTNEDCEPKGINYRMDPRNTPCLTAAGIDCCSLGNNHVLDWGAAGLVETLDVLKAAGIKSTGAGRNLLEAEAPAIVDIAGMGRVVVFSFGTETSGIPHHWAASDIRPGVNRLTDLSDQSVRSITENIKATKQRNDIVVASLHWGPNWGYEVPRDQIMFARALIDNSGVNVVYGHSSHHVKAIEVYKGKPILYGCGDFLNDYEGISGYEEFRADLALMYILTIECGTGTLIDLTMTPFQIKNFRLNRAVARDARWLHDVLNREGKAFGTHVTLTEGSRLVLGWA